MQANVVNLATTVLLWLFLLGLPLFRVWDQWTQGNAGAKQRPCQKKASRASAMIAAIEMQPCVSPELGYCHVMYCDLSRPSPLGTCS